MRCSECGHEVGTAVNLIMCYLFCIQHFQC
jgi:hypothetical protein